MLLTILAFGIGCAIGRLRGGSASGMSSAQFRRPGLLVLGVTTVLILNVIGPAFPIIWAVIGTIAFFFFGLRNLQLTGMIVMLIGLLMNTAPVLANGAMPVSELALISVGEVDDNGRAVVAGLRESTDTATAFAAFGDVIPVPIVNAVVSIGDVVMLVALADIAANLFLRSRRRDELDRAGVTYAEDPTENEAARPAILSPLNLGVSNRPAHAAHRRPRRKAAPSTHIPAHAKQSDFFDLTDPATVIVLDGPDGYVESGVPKNVVPEVTPPEAQIVADPAEVEGSKAVVPKTEIILPDPPQVYDEEAEETQSTGSDPQEAPETSTTGSDPQPEEPAARERSSRSDQQRKVATSTGSVDNKTERSSRSDQQRKVATSTGSVDNKTERSSRSDQQRKVATSTGSVDNKTERSSRSDQQRKVATSTGSVDNKTETADRRPIIDLTESPTDQQLQEFLRRRAEADAAFLARTSPGPRRRRGRAPRRTAEVAETAR